MAHTQQMMMLYCSESANCVQVLQTLNESLIEINASDIKASETNPAFKTSSFFRLSNTYLNEDQMMFD